MRDRVVSVLGAGNLRCGPPVMASLATWQPDDLVTIKLFDANLERLDLFDRFLRECLDKADSSHIVLATTSWAESLEGVTDAIFTLHEDCARRMMGRDEPKLFVPPDPNAIVDQYRGDPNRPTPPENLSPQTATFLSAPIDRGEPREEAINLALVKLLDHVSEGCNVLSLQRGIDLPTQLPHLHLDWPEKVSDYNLSAVPHQVLRWIQGEDTLEQLLLESKESPVSSWLCQ